MKHSIGRLVMLAGLGLFVGGGSLSAGGADVSPLYPDSGIEYHLDASASELNKTLFLDDDYGVTNWMSKADPVSGVTVEFKPGDGTFAPRWLPDFGDGHPAIYFGTDPVGCTSVWTCLKGPAIGSAVPRATGRRQRTGRPPQLRHQSFPRCCNVAVLRVHE